MEPSEEPVRSRGHVALRLDATITNRMDALLPLYATPSRAATRSDALRAVILTGLAIEERRAEQTKGRPVSALVRPRPFESSIVDVGLPMHAASWGNGDVTHVLVHGLGGSHLDWMLVGGGLAEHGRVLAPDLPGFGRTAPQGRMSLARMQAALDRFIAATCGGPVVLVAHAMGSAVAALQAAQRPDTVRALVLVAPILPPELGTRTDFGAVVRALLWMAPFLGPWLSRRRAAKLGAEGAVLDHLGAVLSDFAHVPAICAAHVALEQTRSERPWIDTALVQAARSIFWTLVRPARFYALMKRVAAPTLLVHGARDPITPLSTVRVALLEYPHWRLEVLEGVGHMPPLEAPERFTRAVDAFTAGARGRLAELSSARP